MNKTKKLNFDLFFTLVFLISFFSISIYNISQGYLPCKINLFTNAVEIAKNCGLGDYGQQMKLALDYFDYGKATAENKWVAGNWPIGPVLLNLLSILIVGKTGPFFIPLAILSSILWTYIFLKVLKSVTSKNIIIFIFFLILSFPSYFFTKFFFTFGLIESNGWGTLFLICSFLCFIDLIKCRTKAKIKKKYISTALFLSLSTIFRLNIDIFVYISCFLTIIFIIIVYLFEIYKNKKYFQFDLNKFNYLKKALYIFLFSIIITSPLKIYHKSFINAHPGVSWHNNWLTEEAITEMGGGWVREGGGTISCIIKQDLCKKLDQVQKKYEAEIYLKTGETRRYWNKYFDNSFYRALSVSVFVSDPLKWTYIKWIKIFPNYWFNNGIIEKSSNYNIYDKLFDLILGLMFFYLFYIFIFDSKNRIKLIFIIPLILTFFMIFTFFHFEQRYLLPLKGLIFFTFLIIVLDKCKKTYKDFFKT